MSIRRPNIDEKRVAVVNSTLPPSSGVEHGNIGADWALLVLEQMPDGVALLELGVIAAANDRLAKLLGESVGRDLVGRPLPEPTEPKVGSAQERWARADGSMVHVEVRRSALELAGVQRTLVVARDAATLSLVESQARQADRLAAVGTLAAGVAHQINNPLAYVITNLAHLGERLPEISRLIASGDIVEADRQIVDLLAAVLEAREGSKRVAAIVSDLKMLSRVDDDRHAPVDVARLLDAAANIVATEFGGRVKLSRDYSGVGTVVGNDARLGHVFVNLLMNAAQALQEAGEGPHEVRLVTKNDANGQMVVEISDTGPGIPQSVATRIFDPFFTTKPLGVGTGLGLTTSLGILNAMGGTIEVDSEVGAGATFRVVMPVTAATTIAKRSEPPEPGVKSRPRVLVIDDEVTLTNALRRALHDADVVVRSSGVEALALLEGDHRFDAIVCDIMMPEMSGIETFERVRAKNPELAPRFIFMTGGAFTVEARAFLDAVDNEWLEKPFELSALRRLIRGRAAEKAK